MPLFSIVVPAYNVERGIGRCLESLRTQDFGDFEVIVVDDCSTDNTSAEIEKAIFQDSRFVVIRHEENKGLHLTRKTGVAAARGEYLMFLDGDDEFAQGYFTQLAQGINGKDAELFHVGITVIDNGAGESSCSGFEKQGNNPSQPLQGAEISHAVFNEEAGYQMDWRVTSRLFKVEFAKRAFAEMVSDRLERAEDAYESFVCFALNPRQLPLESCRGYRYHYGEGISGASFMSPQQFERNCRQFEACLAATKAFIDQPAYAHLRTDYEGLRAILHEQIGTDFLFRVADADKSAALDGYLRVCGAAVCARELWRHVRDAYYLLSVNEFSDEDFAHAQLLADLAESVLVVEGDSHDFERYASMKVVGEHHKKDFERSFVMQAYDKQPVKIFVTTHKDVDVPESAVFQPVQVGPGLKNNRYAWAFHDDEGENIADKNPLYCEMTVQYWAWKNALQNAKYVGFCHYRRYFNFSETSYEENSSGEIIDDYIDAEAIEKYGLDDASVLKAIEGYDVIYAASHDLREMFGDFSTPYEQYAAAPLLHIQDIDHMVGIIARLYPDYVADARAYLNGHRSSFCNMYIMRTEIFEQYCAWAFPILASYCEQADLSTYSKEALRTPGHLAERLFNIYLMHAQRTKAGWKTKELQCVHFEKPERAHPLMPLVEVEPRARGRVIVPIVFAADDAYAPMVATTIQSILTNANPEAYYDLVVLERNMEPSRKAALERQAASFGNARVRFENVERMIEGYDLSTNNEHISLETYYRFLIPEIMSHYGKVLYLDCDLVVEGDIYELFKTPLGNNLLAAVTDIDYLANLNQNDGERMRYTTETLGMKNPYHYFQAGVLLFNIHELQRFKSVPEWLDIVSNGNYIYDDQDILNKECEGRVLYLPPEWNVMHNCVGRVDWLFCYAPNSIYDAYMQARQAPKIIHYAGVDKPWNSPHTDLGHVFWAYARQTAFYEEFIARLAGTISYETIEQRLENIELSSEQHEKVLSENSNLRRYVDPILPLGTKRREVIKAIGRSLRGKK